MSALSLLSLSGLSLATTPAGGDGLGLPLDGAAIAAAYSVSRRLRSDYVGPAIRVRRSSDGLEADIPFADNLLDTAALLTHVGAGSGFVSVLYDQSGNARNTTQTVVADQMRLVNAGVIDTANGKPALTTVTNRSHLNGVLNVSGLANLYVNTVALTPGALAVGSSGPNFIHWFEAGGWGQVFMGANQTQIGWRFGTSQSNTNRVANLGAGSALAVRSVIKVGATDYARVNGVESVPTTTGLTDTANISANFRFGARAEDVVPWTVPGTKITECVISTVAIGAPFMLAIEASQAFFYAIPFE